MLFFFFFFNDTATTEIYTLSLHDALPIFAGMKSALEPTRPSIRKLTMRVSGGGLGETSEVVLGQARGTVDRKSTRLNSSHSQISYAVFCLKKKKKDIHNNSDSKSGGDTLN